MFSLSQAGATPGEGLQLATLVWASLAPAIKLALRFLFMRFGRIAGFRGAAGHSDREFTPMGVGAKPINEVF